MVTTEENLYLAYEGQTRKKWPMFSKLLQDLAPFILPSEPALRSVNNHTAVSTEASWLVTVRKNGGNIVCILISRNKFKTCRHYYSKTKEWVKNLGGWQESYILHHLGAT